MTGRPRLEAIALGFLAALGLTTPFIALIFAVTSPDRLLTTVLIVIALTAGLGGAWLAVRKLNRWRAILATARLGEEQKPLPAGDSLESLMNRLAVELNSARADRESAITDQQFVAARLEAIVTGLRDGVVIVDQDLAIVSINPAACSQFVTSRAGAIGKPLVEVTRDYDLVRVARESVELGTDQITPIDFRRLGRQLNVRVAPIEQGNRRLAVLVVQDETEQRRLENVRKDFVANVSHELRTPLASIRVLVETLADGAIDDPEVAGPFLNQVVAEVDRLNELIEDLLDLGRLESGRLPLKRSRVAIDDLIRESIDRVRLASSEANIAIDYQPNSALPEIEVDISRIEQVMANLLANAIKFSPPSSRVDVTVRACPDAVMISVRDEGEGILPEDLPRIFERFYKSDRARNSGGSGLGLAIARHVVGAHGGEITVESTFGSGSTFTVRLPQALESAPA
jgi:two-component system phosphate regulon sensor histidine kinase PhoR